jgi:hypothetical protein
MTEEQPPQQQELPWWTQEELEQVVAAEVIHEANRVNHPKLPSFDEFMNGASLQPQQEQQPQRLIYLKRDVLNKYVNHPYIHITNDYIRFLSKAKEPDSMIPFTSTTNSDYITMEAKHWVNIPPRQLQHWANHELSRSESK